MKFMAVAIELTILGLLVVMICMLLVVCGKKSMKSLLSLVLTSLILLFVIIPLIINGYDPVVVTFLSAIPVVILIIYITEGFTTLSHLSIVITLITFFATSLLVEASVIAGHFTGIISDVAVTVGGQLGIDLPKLLVAGIMLGTLGVLAEMIVTQVATVIELVASNPQADRHQIFEQSYRVGVVHLSSIINTLFLIYAGIVLPMLIIFLAVKSSLYSALNYEPLSSEIIRILVSTIGLIASMPIATFLSVVWLTRKKRTSS